MARRRAAREPVAARPADLAGRGAMDNCCEDKACELDALRARQAHVLWVVLGINAAMFAIEQLAGWLAGSLALQADSLDMLGDTTVYAFTLFAIARSTRWRASAVLLKGASWPVSRCGCSARVSIGC